MGSVSERLQEHRDRQEARRLKDCARLEKGKELKGRAASKWYKEHSRLVDFEEAEEKIQKGEMLADPDLAPFVCDICFSFLHRRKYDDNHEVGDILQKQFPQGLDDSELGEGLFFISRQFKEEVKAFLRPKARFTVSKTDGLLISSPEGVQEYLARQAALDYSI